MTLDLIRGRQVVVSLTNKSGGAVAAGDVVVVDTTTDESFTTTTTAALERSIGIAQETIANNASGRVLLAGYAALVNVAASVTRGHYLSTSTVAKQATGAAGRAPGAFGQFLKTSATPSAWIWGMADPTAAGAIAAAIVDAAGDIIIATAADTVARLARGSDGQVFRSTATTAAWEDDFYDIPFIIDGGGSAITTGVKGFIRTSNPGTIVAATLLLDQSGSIVVDIWKDTYANYPPVVADSITAAAKPTVTTATKSEDTTLTGWTTAIAAGDVLGFNVDSITTATRATLHLKVRKT